MLVRPDGKVTTKAERISGAKKRETKIETETLNVMEEEEKEDQEKPADKHPERGLLQGGSDGKGLGQDMATVDQRFTADADSWAAGPPGDRWRQGIWQ